jgi:hypothetical protein
MPSDNKTPEVFKIDDDIVEEKHTGSVVLGKEPEPKIKMITDPKIVRKEKSKKSKPSVRTSKVLGNRVPKTKFIKITKKDIEAKIDVKVKLPKKKKDVSKQKRESYGRFVKPDQVLPPKKPSPGRPTDYTQELADIICEKLAMGKSLRTALLEENMPGMATVFRWLRENTEFREQYARAKEEGADAMADEILDIADDGSNDWETRTNKRGEEYEVVNKEVVMRSRLRIDTRRWLMSKMKPKKYGEKLDLTSGGDKINNPYAAKSLEELKEIAKEMQSEEEIRSRK